MTAAQYFSTDPSDARRLFLSACLDARLPVASFEAPRSNQDELPVHIDVAHAGQTTAATVIVVCPGTRMVEGLCASGIQTTLLRTGLQIEMPGPMAMVLVHSLVPAAFEMAAWDGLAEQSAVETEWDDSLLAAAENRFNEDRQQVKTMTVKFKKQQARLERAEDACRTRTETLKEAQKTVRDQDAEMQDMAAEIASLKLQSKDASRTDLDEQVRSSSLRVKGNSDGGKCILLE